MDITKIAAIVLICFVCLGILCIVVLKLVSKYLVIQHNIHVTIDGKNKKVAEDFTIVTGYDVPVGNDPALKVTNKCENKSLNDMHKTGEIVKKPWETSCKTSTSDEEGEEKFYKKFKPYQMYNDSEILGANYFMYNNAPNPYKLDFTLYDKDAPTIAPVGTNYVLN